MQKHLDQPNPPPSQKPPLYNPLALKKKTGASIPKPRPDALPKNDPPSKHTNPIAYNPLQVKKRANKRRVQANINNPPMPTVQI